jgi:hypothetical protein
MHAACVDHPTYCSGCAAPPCLISVHGDPLQDHPGLLDVGIDRNNVFGEICIVVAAPPDARRLR